MDYTNIITKKLFVAKCPKCPGMLYVEHDPQDGDCYVCYQCGKRVYLQTSLPKTNKQTY